MYKIEVREEGREPATERRFSTLKAVQSYIKERWQGVEYMDSYEYFHTDYCTFDLFYFTLADLGYRDPNDQWNWIWKELA
jgi:hypothetical protein